MTVSSKFKIGSVVFILFILSSALLFFCRNLYLQLAGSSHATNLFRKIGDTTGTTLTTAVFGIFVLAIIFFEFLKKFTSISLSDNTITYKQFLKKKKHIDIRDVISLHSHYEITRANLFPNELLVITLKKGKIHLSKMYMSNFVEIKTALIEKISPKD